MRFNVCVCGGDCGKKKTKTKLYCVDTFQLARQ